MQITIPDEFAASLQSRAAAAGYQDLSAFILHVAGAAPPASPASADVAPGSLSFFDAAKACGFIGGGGEFPPDLSTNPAHMEGFGQ